MRTLTLVLSLVSTVCLAAGHPVTQPTFGSSPFFPQAPSVAAAGGHFVTVWTASNRLFESVADRNGNMLTPAAVPLFDAYANAQVVGAADHFVVLTRNGDQSELHVLSSDGALVGSLANPSIPPIQDPRLAWNGEELAVVDHDYLSAVSAHILRSDGSAVKTNIAIAKGAYAYAVTATSTDFLIATAELSGIFLTRVGRDGTVHDRTAVGAGAVRIAIATSGNETLLCWFDQQSLWSARIASDGTISSPLELPRPANTSRILLQWTGEHYVAVVSGQQAFALRLDRAGSLLESPVMLGEAIDSMATLGEVVYGAGQRFLIGPDRRLIGTVFHTDTGVVRQQLISINLRQQTAPAIASDGMNFFSAWIDESGEGKTIAAARLSRGGVSLDPDGIEVGAARQLYMAAPAVAYGGSTYIVVWSDTKNVLARRYRTDGTAIDPQPVLLGPGSMYFAPAVAWNGSAFMTAWTDAQGASGAMIGPSGPPAAPMRLSFYPFLWPDLAWNGSEFLLVGGVGQTCPFECPILHGVTGAIRLHADGSPIDAGAIPIDAPQIADYSPTSRATVASNGSGFLVALDGYRDVTVVPVTAAGGVGAEKSVFKWFGGIQSDITTDGSNYLLTWNYRGPTISQTWLATTHLDADGNPASIVYTTVDSGTSTPSIAVNSLGDSLTVIGVPDQPSTVVRVLGFLNWEMKPVPQPPRPPRNASAIGDSQNFVVRWSGTSTDTEGIVVDYVMSNGQRNAIAVVPVEAQALFRSVAITWVEVRAFNPGGMSEPLAVGVSPPSRHRVSR